MSDGGLKLSECGVRVPDILLPRESVMSSLWPVVACDQYTAQVSHWQAFEAAIGNAPSTLHMIFPEAYLSEGFGRVSAIHRTMDTYLAEGIFEAPLHGFVLTLRTTESGTRAGLMLAIDLEQYDFTPGAQALIRPTEGTILERIPPRVRIRAGAPLETPHVMLLVDDPQGLLIAPWVAQRERLPKRYDITLLGGGGRLEGYALAGQAAEQRVAQALSALAAKAQGMLLAVGDGNHSLATARQIWLDLRDGMVPARRADHPARYALVEVVNLHDPALVFEPIHRALFGVEPAALMQAWTDFAAAQGITIAHRPPQAGEAGLGLIAPGLDDVWAHRLPTDALLLTPLQAFLDAYLAGHPEAGIDYIHGEQALRQVCDKPGALGLLVPSMDKFALFPAVRTGGVLPRKTFSMGHAHEKRYYMECRRMAP